MRDFRTLFTTRELNDIYMFIHKFKDECGWMSEDRVRSLAIAVESARHVAEVAEFREHIVAAMPPNNISEEDYDAAWEKFYETKWQIWFGDKLLMIPNGATIYNHIVDLLDDYIDNEL